MEKIETIYFREEEIKIFKTMNEWSSKGRLGISVYPFSSDYVYTAHLTTVWLL